jgi:hypothetical protein
MVFFMCNSWDPIFLIECKNFFEENFFAVQSNFFPDGMCISGVRMGFKLIGKMLDGRWNRPSNKFYQTSYHAGDTLLL